MSTHSAPLTSWPLRQPVVFLILATMTWLALRAHMKKAVNDRVDIGIAVKSFDAKPFANLKHAEVWIPQLANQTCLELERE